MFYQFRPRYNHEHQGFKHLLNADKNNTCSTDTLQATEVGSEAIFFQVFVRTIKQFPLQAVLNMYDEEVALPKPVSFPPVFIRVLQCFQDIKTTAVRHLDESLITQNIKGTGSFSHLLLTLLSHTHIGTSKYLL